MCLNVTIDRLNNIILTHKMAACSNIPNIYDIIFYQIQLFVCALRGPQAENVENFFY